MSEQPLFAGFEPPPVFDPSADLSAGRRLTLRQADLISKGVHPLTKRPVHLLADISPAPTDAKDLPYRCGSCYFRVVMGHHTRSYPKCTRYGSTYVTHSTSSDVRAWWPACRDYSPGDTSMSPDAARDLGDAS